MPFEKVETQQVDFPAQERAILAFWDRIDAFNRLRAKNRGKPAWSFLDGPITANNPMGVHHAWGRTYKDAYQRYFAMTGHELRYQNGFDCQGLWVEVEVEKELKLASKRDIENLVPGDIFASIDEFVTLCKERVNKFARVQTNQSIRLGYWMDWDRSDADWAKSPDERKSYFTMSEENNYTIWSFLKKCHDHGLIYKGYDAMPWCGRCGTGISQQEMNEGYKLVAHRSIFVRFPLRDRPNENLLVWTTTPWTLSSNVGAAVNPELTYLKVKQGGQVYYVGKSAFKTARLEEQFKAKEWVEGVPKLKTLEQIFKEKSKEGFEIVGEVQGSELVGLAYDGPFDELEAQEHPAGYPFEIATVVRQQNWAPAITGKTVHRVIAWKEVGETEGTGIVHIAPGCGKEDFALGREEGLPPIAPLDETGHFLTGFGYLAGMAANSQEVVETVVGSLKGKGLLFATELYPHKYPHCWRCKSELLYRLVDEWFIGVGTKPKIVCKDINGTTVEEEYWEPGAYRTQIANTVAKATFLPEELNGKARELDWLRNMGDWMISKKRFWGLALPIWICENCGLYEVIGSRNELRQRAVGDCWQHFEGHTPHRPWIDRIEIECGNCHALMRRIRDVGNPWLDAGIVAFSTMGFNRDRERWRKWYPADFITESFPGQFRNWFYALLAMSTMMSQGTAKEGQPPFNALLGHGLVLDERGETMSKSKGNSIAFDEAADKMGADVCRWLYCRSNPVGNINFGYASADEVRAKFILKLWNTYAFFCNYARLDGFDPTAPQVPVKERPDIDRWIISDLQLLVKKAHAAFQSYDVMSFCLEAEKFVDDKLSNWYIRRNRRRFWKGEQGADKLAAYQTLYTVLTMLTKLFAPAIPFLAETVWQNLRMANDEESVHLCEYPVADESLIDAELSEDMDALLRLVSLGGAARNMAKIKVRQPLEELKVQAGSPVEERALRKLADQLSEELNVKRVTPHQRSSGQLLELVVKANMKSLGSKCAGRIQQIKNAIEKPSEYSDAIFSLIDGSEEEVEIVFSDGSVTIDRNDLIISPQVKPGWIGLLDRAPRINKRIMGMTEIALDTRITPELAREGMARDIVRQVQDQRKIAGLEMEDRIILFLGTDSPKLKEAIETHRATIAAETLTQQWADTPLAGAHSATVKIDGQALTIALKKV
jgi:isoleucyl-tRNA synthetase